MTKPLQLYQSPDITVGCDPNLRAHARGPVTVRVLGDGPALVRGAVTLELPSGDAQPRTSFARCRCGGTRETPFCDGSHARNGFRSRPAK